MSDVWMAKKVWQGLEKAIEYQPDLILLMFFNALKWMALNHWVDSSRMHYKYYSRYFYYRLNDSSHEEKALLMRQWITSKKPLHTNICTGSVTSSFAAYKDKRKMLEKY